MAVTSENLFTKMIVSYHHGVVDGKDKMSDKTYSNIKTTATDEAVYNLAIAIDEITVPTLVEVKRQVSTLLIP
ncbi:MAG: DUF1659 domain-containing protein [Eubacteriaceae bacterium]